MCHYICVNKIVRGYKRRKSEREGRRGGIERERESTVGGDYEIGEDCAIVSVRTHASNFNFPDD